MSSMRDILVIDDEPVVLQGVERICGGEGLSVEAVASAGEGLARVAQRTYRLVLCDIMMEGLDGFGFLGELRRRGVAVPVALTTGYCRGEHAVRALQAGAIDYLAKPFTADELLAVLERGLRSAAADASPAAPPVAGWHALGGMSWARGEAEGAMRIGVQDRYLRTLPGVTRVELLAVGHDVVQGLPCATLISTSGLAHRLLAPVSGRVIEVNPAAPDPALVLRDPHGPGWLYRLLPNDVEYNLECLAAGRTTPSGISEGDAP